MRVSFYELPSSVGSDYEALISHVGELLLSHYQRKQYLTLICKDKAQAEAVDEYIWQQPAEHFIAHNLLGEGPANGSPVEITWKDAIDTSVVRNKKLVINLSQTFLPQYAAWQHLVDFVPSDSEEKASARERYKQYKQAGCSMAFVNAN
ncbi:DNA polymerase III subunit chi [Glaciecola sp. XM2]|jgi:DNA polymerase-3 subunit chi|uniref:DNA polymerase III subunit chi n=1 Tax=Glaciecola sp. XM2 TaxID=1914931 RepID=UPI001BDE6AFB|nr:DNA polymerase III subunit chi [Glaciecola sp. XM2]MBT1452516.1 DNA polymerase III subunit chi [Glaciecola sp. XM2]